MASRFPFSGLDVLIVERNHFMRKIICQVLRAFGVEDIREVTDGADALREIRMHRPDIVLTDLMLDTVDGLEFTRVLRKSKDSPAPTLPVVMLTAYTEAHNVRAARDAGVTEFMAKPLTAIGLLTRMRAALEKKRTFVKGRTFAGPDRRRSRRKEEYGGPNRRDKVIETVEAA